MRDEEAEAGKTTNYNARQREETEMSEARRVPEDKEALEYLMVASNMRDFLQTAARLLQEARSPFEVGSGRDREWLEASSQFVAAIDFEFFGGPPPGGPSFPY